jgi:hypothetical protein
VPIPMEPSTLLRAGLESGELIRYGAIIKNSGTGKIVGHLKETGLMESAISSLFGAPQNLLKAANPLSFVTDIGGHAINFQQIRSVGKSVEEVKTLVEGLQLATNVAAFGSVASLGVSAAGFVYTANKLKKIESKLDSVASDIAVVKATLDELNINWSAMAEARLLAASEALIVAEQAATQARRSQLAREAVSEFSQLRHYYAQLLKNRGIFDDNRLDVDSIWEIVSRYTLSCLGILRAEFILGDLGTYGAFLRSVIEEYGSLVSFKAKDVYLSRCDAVTPLNLEIDHQQLSDGLSTLVSINLENIARLESHQTELEFVLKNDLTADQYLEELRDHDSDIVLLKH